jgi:TldD protein
MSNTFIEPGEAELEDMIQEMGDGVLLNRARGGYVDPTRGHFSFSVETGFEVRDGKIGAQIRNCTLTGYTLETLAGVLAVSKQFQLLDRGMCGKKGQEVPTSIGGPYILVRHLTLGGSRTG